METTLFVTQTPPAGESRLLFCGDCITLTLTLSAQVPGRAWVRTNVGSAGVSRREIIRRVEGNEIKLDEAWYDIEMVRETDLVYEIVLPLHQTGFFQAKCFFMPEKTLTPVWPPGDNCIFNVEPAGTCGANIIYNAFVRQFGRSKYQETDNPEVLAGIQQLDAKGYTVIPESGKFRDLKKEVGFIFSRLGCRVLHLLPIHPIPTTYARMGRFGSPYAALNFTEVDPGLAEFDPLATPLEQFLELVDAVHFHNGYLFMDIAINHTGWAASIHETHPEWLVRDEKGKIEAPGAWGVVWEDLTKLNYANIDLWKYMAGMFLLWCHRGVDGFRCDAGYMVPVEAWEYIVAKVRNEYPETLFFLEGLGGPIKTMREILNKANFNWAYSEVFQTHTSQEISAYLPQAYEISATSGLMIHFAETHDNNRLASVSRCYAQMRTSLCALFSVCGGFGFANGVEWFATQKINVHESPSLNWGDENNQVDHISRLNLILQTHPAFFGHTRLALIQKNHDHCLVLLRHHEPSGKKVLILANLDCENSREAVWHREDAQQDPSFFHDLISKAEAKVHEAHGLCRTGLAPGQVLALTQDPKDLTDLDQTGQRTSPVPERVYQQKLKAKLLALHIALKGYGNVKGLDLEQKTLAFVHDPLEFIRGYNTASRESRVIEFEFPRDLKRQIMIPPGFLLMIQSPHGFRAELLDESRTNKTSLGYEEGISGRNGFFALFLPRKIKTQPREYFLSLRVFTPQGTRIEKVSLLFLAPFDSLVLRSSFTRKEIVKTPFLKVLATTRLGAMMRAAAWWGRLDSRYDGFLGANRDKTLPENRWMVLSRCRIWAIFQGYSRELTADCLERFTFSYGHGGKWVFHVPTSEGKYYAVALSLALDPEENHVRLSIQRKRSPLANPLFLEDDKPVTFVVRPDIEDRSFHDTVKAFTGPEHLWPRAIKPLENGFRFSLAQGQFLAMGISPGQFVQDPEWQYMVHRPMEAQRGLDPDSDLFSPGYFTSSCQGGETIRVQARVVETQDQGFFSKSLEPYSFPREIAFPQAITQSLDAFLVERGRDKSVIAGYPWFLDWGRDSLIFCRSLIQLGRFSDAKTILRLFGRFENRGTLPNMICGQDARNIETSDAPLWFFACCKDLLEQEKTMDFLDESLDQRLVKDILLSIAHSLLEGTPTGVKADPETMLLYSPSHFTWMDTNFPAGSPRQGYPIEIQALWYNALVLLAAIDPVHTTDWQEKAKMVQQWILDLFYDKGRGYFSDCLHSEGPGSARAAKADDALRPNQLFLFTLDVIDDKTIARTCVETCQQLLVPGGIRSLADRRVETPLPIYYNGKLVNDPHFPYFGEYKGDEDSQRKPAYHNGTAWTWPFPVFCEAWAKAFGKNSFPTCLAWLGSVLPLMRQGAAGYIPEILDGDFPHRPRGCDAQAWGSSEVARVMHKLLR